MQLVNGLHFNNLKGDIYGGITAAVVALPLALAFGVASGAGPIAGLYGAIFVGFFAALFGGTPAQVSGPTGPMTVVMAVIFTQFTSMFPDDPLKGAALAFSVVILGGLFQVLFGVLRLGRYIELVPHPVISGFMSGIGVIIILLQLGPILGHAGASQPLVAVQEAAGYFLNGHHPALILGVVALVIVYGVPRFLPRLNKLMPSPLIALLVGTGVYLTLLPDSGAPILGDIPTGFPTLIVPSFELSLLPEVIKSALVLAALGSIDSLLTSLVADNVTRTYHKSNRELIGQGIGNTIAGFFGGLPGAGATMRTVVNVKAGGLTPISGSIHAVILLFVVLGAGSFAANIPKAVLAGILIKVGTDIIDWDYLKRLTTAPKAGVVIMFTVFFFTVFVDLISAVAIGLIMASFLFMQRMVDLQLKNMEPIISSEAELPLTEEEKETLDQANGRLLLYHLGGPLSFGAAKGMVRRLASFDQYDALLLDFCSVPVIDFTSSMAVEDMILDAKTRGRSVYIINCHDKVINFLRKQGVLVHLDDDSQFLDRSSALKYAYSKLE
ncbi:MAG: SulP family inorganic anion transporter [Gammaproteobacteria bacterium]|nr:MAG: SulP family inorganic anion transporter [Gammaproteobacteria bacterium]